MFNQLKISFTEILKDEDKDRIVKIILMRYELVARYCQFAESIGALILGYHHLKLSSNTELNKDHSKQILTDIEFGLKMRMIFLQFCIEIEKSKKKLFYLLTLILNTLLNPLIIVKYFTKL
jgi:hypothetical protein